VKGDTGIDVDECILNSLTGWYMKSRYPENWLIATSADAEEALSVAESIFEATSAYIHDIKDAE
jgi:HEPN domain-containing protein